MAFDKVVDSAVLESGLTSIANAIREKAGTSDALAFPAGFLEAIAAIESGGGAKVAYGTFTVAQDYTTSGNFEVVHNLGIVPDFLIVSLCNVGLSSKKYEVDTAFGRRTGTESIFSSLASQKVLYKNDSTSASTLNYRFGVSTTNTNGIDVTDNNNVYIKNTNETSFQLLYSTNRFYYSGRTYFWLAVGGMV